MLRVGAGVDDSISSMQLYPRTEMKYLVRPKFVPQCQLRSSEYILQIRSRLITSLFNLEKEKCSNCNLLCFRAITITTALVFCTLIKATKALNGSTENF